MAKSKKVLWIILSVVLVVCIAVSVTLAVLLTAKHKHELTVHGGRTPTCTANGNILYWECEICQKYYSDEFGRHEVELADVWLPAKGHNLVQNVCTICGYTVLPGANNLSYTEIKNENGEVVAYALAGIGSCTDTDVVIPVTHNKLPVTEILADAFRDNTQIVSLTIPSGVTSIGDGAFDGCVNLENIFVDEYNTQFISDSGNLYSKGKTELLRYAPAKTLDTFQMPASVTAIHDGAFHNAGNLENLQMPVDSKCLEIKSNAFEGCSNLKTATVAPSVTQIGQGAFYGCGKLQQLTLPFVGNRKNVGETNQYPFGFIFGTTSFAGSEETEQFFHYTSPVATTKFTYCVPSSLTSVKVTGGSLSYGAFYNCVNLREVILDGVTSIASYAFSDCNITDVTVPESVKTIGDYAFNNCRALTIRCQTAVKPNVWSLYWNGCGNPVVWDCNKNDVASDGNVYFTSEGLRFALNTNATVAIQPLNTSGNVVIPSSVTYNKKTYNVTAVAANAFEGCKRLETVTIPISVTAVGEKAFANCQNLVLRCEAAAAPGGWNGFNVDGCPVVWNCTKSEVADDGYIYIVDNGIRFALKNGNATVSKQSLSVTTADIPQSISYKDDSYPVVSVADGAFKNLPLTRVSLPSSVVSIGTGAFENCKYLTEIVLPQSVATVSANAFYGCDALTVQCQAASKPAGFADSFCKLSETADCPVVWNCNENDVATDGCVYIVANGVRYALKSGKATVARQALSLGGEVKLLTAVSHNKVSYALVAIADYAFNNCVRLQSVQIPAGVQFIGSYAFAGCSGLVSAALPDGITQLETGCFQGCSSLESLSIPSSVVAIRFDVFAQCSKLITVSFELNSKCQAIGSGAFADCASLLRITIPQTVTSIGKQAFLHCTSLKTVRFGNSEDWWFAASSTAITGTRVDSETFANTSAAAAFLVENSQYYFKRGGLYD